MIVVEGLEWKCRHFWDTIRRWNWAKLVIKHIETSAPSPPAKQTNQQQQQTNDNNNKNNKENSKSDLETATCGVAIETFSKLNKYSEILSCANSTTQNSKHMDMGKFKQYLTERGLEHGFQVLFGLEGGASK